MAAFAIQTARLTLRDWTEADLAPFLEHTNTPEVMRWLGGVQSGEEVRRRLRARIMVWQRTRGFTFWAVERKADAALLGFCGLKIADDEGSPVEGLHEIGWRLRADAWGQGYAREAATASLDFAFAILAAPRVVALTVIGNTASWGLMERLGMVRRADLDYPGPAWAETPVIVYEMEKERWTASRC
jgi:RimJ/RimL family protein N-acetyltransferase